VSGSYLVRERLAVSKLAASKFEADRFDVKKLNEMAVKEQHQIKISNIFTAVKTDVNEDFYGTWESIESISDFDEESLGYYKWKQICVCVCVS